MLTTEAQIFVLERGVAQTWTESSTRPVPVHLYHDLSRQSFRLIAVEGSKPVLNGVVTPGVQLNKASSKFLQWMDLRSAVVHGLGFASERQLDKFVETVGRMQELCAEKYNSEEAEESVTPRDPDSEESESLGHQALLKLENLRLKAALTQSSANAKKWETELGNLKELNSELRSALASRETPSASKDGKTDVDSILAQIRAVLEAQGLAKPDQHPDTLVKRLKEVLGSGGDWMREAESKSAMVDAKLSELVELYSDLHGLLSQPPNLSSLSSPKDRPF